MNLSRRTFIGLIGGAFVAQVADVWTPPALFQTASPIDPNSFVSVFEFQFTARETGLCTLSRVGGDGPLLQFGASAGGIVRWVAAPDAEIKFRNLDAIAVDGPGIDSWDITYQQDDRVFLSTHDGIVVPLVPPDSKMPVWGADYDEDVA